jgi:MFS family permease
MEPTFSSDVPARLDALPWSRWHWRLVFALGITWLLDGVEVTVVGAIAGILERPEALGLSPGQIGWAGSSYVGGAVIGALFFGRLADRLGRKRLFLITIAIYTAGTVLTAGSVGFVSFLVCRMLTGFGIGGEYSAINSAIDELIPARIRGTIDLAINGSFWLGALAGAAWSLFLLDPAILPVAIGWRLAFACGAVLGVGILLVRRDVPESPRWLLSRGRPELAESVMGQIEKWVAQSAEPWPRPRRLLVIAVRPPASLREIGELLLVRERRRTVLGLSLMIAQAFFYNAIFFTYALVLTRFYGVSAESVGKYVIPFAVGNFLGPIVLGPAFDRIGRRAMIALTYAVSGLGLLATGWAFMHGWLDASSQTWCWSALFFFASAAASSAYLTVSEIFPVEIRAIAISIFYAAGTGAGGFLAPALFGALIESESRRAVFLGYFLGALFMLGGAAAAALLGVAAERRPLEEVARPLGEVDPPPSGP